MLQCSPVQDPRAGRRVRCSYGRSQEGAVQRSALRCAGFGRFFASRRLLSSPSSRPLATMPTAIEMQALLAEQFADTRVVDEISNPPTKAESIVLLDKLSAFVQLYHPPTPFFKSPTSQVLWDRWSKRMERSLASLNAEHAAERTGLMLVRRERLFRLLYGPNFSSRPLTMVRSFTSTLHEASSSSSCVAEQLMRDDPQRQHEDSGGSSPVQVWSCSSTL